MFHIESFDSDLSIISSDPYAVCICEDNRPRCDILDYNVTAYPGALFPVNVIIVGQQFGAIPATVAAEVLPSPNEPNGRVLNTYRRQLVADQCTTLQYSVLSSKYEEVLELTVENPIDIFYPKFIPTLRQNIWSYASAWHRPLNMHVSLQLCPLGFELSAKLSQCI